MADPKIVKKTFWNNLNAPISDILSKKELNFLFGKRILEKIKNGKNKIFAYISLVFKGLNEL